MNSKDMDAFYRYMSVQYGMADSIAFDERISKLGDFLGKSAKSIVNMRLEKNSAEELYVVLGYYISDIYPHVRYMRKLNVKYVQLNLLTLEFLADFLMFKKYPDKNHCIYLFSKYRKNIDNAANHTEYAAYYNRLYQNFKYQPSFDWWNYMSVGTSGIFFLLGHEWAHTQRRFISCTSGLLQMFQSTILSEIPSLSKVVLDEEVACDFIALSILDTVLKESKSNVDAQRIAMQALAVIPLYSLIRSFAHVKNENGDDNLDNALIRIDEWLKTRLESVSLAVEIAHETHLLFQSIDVQSSVKDIFRLIQIFYEHLSDFWMNDLVPGFNAFASQNIEERKKYYLSKNISHLIQIY